jgi:hypothetical protein
MRFRLKYFYTIIYIYIYIYGASQNLVPNSNLEIHFDCNPGSIEWASPWCGVNPVGYLNSCVNHPYFSVPTQSFSPGYPSYQTPHSGNAYAEFVFISPTSSVVARYPNVPLIDTLAVGKIYCVTYYVSLWNDCKYSADKLGALFTAVPFDCTVGNQNLYTGYTPQVVSMPGVLYDDTLNWMEVSGTFTATGTEAYLTIGNFFSNTAHTYSISYPGGVRNLADYYLDDVSVEEVEVVKARNDTSIVLGDSIVVGANLGEANLYNWQPTAGLSCTNCPNPKASPTVNTTYTVTKTQCKVTTTDVITVSVSPTGLFEYSKERGRMKIYTNPNNGNFTLKYDFVKDITEAEVMVEDVTGKLIYATKLNVANRSINMNLTNINNGIYFVKVMHEKEIISVNKVIINN